MGTRLSKHDGGPTRAPPRGNDAADGAARPLVRKRAASSSPPPSPRAPSRPRTEASEHSSKSDDNKDHSDGAALRAGAAGPAPAAAAAQAQAASATADVAAVDGLSKNARKRLQRQHKWEQERDQRRAKHREEKQRLREQRVAQGLPANSRKKKNKIVQEASGVRVAIDCGFEDYMVDSEVRSTVSQLGFSYTSNRLPPKRLDLFVTSFTPRIKALTQQRLPTYAAWRNMSFHDEHYTQIFDKSECVYLTADSPNVITQLDPTKVYIVGGIVDRNRHKRLCLGEAEKHGVAHARLPIDSYVAMSARKVLTINHVVEILINQVNKDDWKESFLKVLPQRKGAKAKSDTDEGSTHADGARGESERGDDDTVDGDLHDDEAGAERLGERAEMESDDDDAHEKDPQEAGTADGTSAGDGAKESN